MAPLILLASLGGLVWVIWRTILRDILVKSPLSNIPGPHSDSFWTGNILRWVSRKGGEFQLEVIQKYGPVVRLHGLMNQPMLYVYDLKALHNIIIKDQYVYEEARVFTTMNRLVFGPSILAATGDVHKKQRKMMNPVFSTAHMRYLMPSFYEVLSRLRTALASRVINGPEELDMLNYMGRTALELIGQGGFGYSFDPLVRDAPNDYAAALKALFPAGFALGLVRQFMPYLVHIGPPTFRRWIVERLPSKRVKRFLKIIDTLHETSSEIYRRRKIAVERGEDTADEGKDLLSVLIRENMNSESGEKLSEDELLAQISAITFGATDTTSNTLARMLHLLAQHPDAQQKLREEIIAAQKTTKDQFSYDELMQLPYLDAVCRETLRRYPPATLISREARKDVILPLSEPLRGVDGQMMNEIAIPEGTRIFVGITGSNLNSALWGDDALEWKPERWLSPLPKALQEARIPGIYANQMTFIGGGRACIGFKFSEMEMKMVLATLLPAFTFELTEKPIVWNMGGIQYPTIGSESNRAELPLKVGLYTKVQ